MGIESSSCCTGSTRASSWNRLVLRSAGGVHFFLKTISTIGTTSSSYCLSSTRASSWGVLVLGVNRRISLFPGSHSGYRHHDEPELLLKFNLSQLMGHTGFGADTACLGRSFESSTSHWHKIPEKLSSHRRRQANHTHQPDLMGHGESEILSKLNSSQLMGHARSKGWGGGLPDMLVSSWM